MSRTLYLLAAGVLLVLGIAAWIALDSLMRIGGDSCEIYCGPGTMFLPIALMGISPLLIVAAIAVAVVGVVRARARRS